MKKDNIKKYIKNNILLLFFVISSLINSTLVRVNLLEDIFTLKPVLIDLGIILLISSFS